MAIKIRRERKRDERYYTLIVAISHSRRSKNITQRELASQLGRDQTYVSKIEKGERKIDVIEFIDICKALNVDVFEILTKSRLITKD